MFAGVEVDVPPLVSADELLDTLYGIVDGMTDAEAIVLAISDWFDAPVGGFPDLTYRPISAESRQFSLYQGAKVKLHTAAASENIRDTLKGLAIAAMAGRDVLSGDISQKRELLRMGGHYL